MITNNDIVVIENLTLTQQELDVCKKIANNTVETWQKSRTEEEKLRDTCLGKFAEKALKNFFSFDSYGGFNPFIAFYDDFRVDDFKCHNSIDFIFSNGLTNLLKIQKYIQENLSHQNSKLNAEHRKIFKDLKVEIGEIKATRIADRLINNGEVNLSSILKDDFLTYPFFTRKSVISNNAEYFEKYQKENNLTKEELLKKEKSVLCNWYFRVYIKENPNNVASCDAYIIGALPGVDFIEKFNIKKMIKNNKSESAVYLSVPLFEGMAINNFKESKITKISFPNSLNSYHQSMANEMLIKSKNKM